LRAEARAGLLRRLPQHVEAELDLFARWSCHKTKRVLKPEFRQPQPAESRGDKTSASSKATLEYFGAEIDTDTSSGAPERPRAPLLRNAEERNSPQNTPLGSHDAIALISKLKIIGLG
jgi:hypothetical protein